MTRLIYSTKTVKVCRVIPRCIREFCAHLNSEFGKSLLWKKQQSSAD